MIKSEMQVTFIDNMGSDLTVANAARVSFDKESDWEIDFEGETPVEDESGKISYKGEFSKRLKETDAKIIRYLAKHNHWTPFGHCSAQFRVKAPIFVARQLVKHQVGLVWNEVSRRYVDSPPEYWFPKTWRVRPDGSIKQGSGSELDITSATHEHCMEELESAVQCCDGIYEELLNMGVAPEQARIVLPLNMMTEWYWTGSLAAWARVCKLRLDPHAQIEVQEVAKLINDHMAKAFPVAWEALMEN